VARRGGLLRRRLGGGRRTGRRQLDLVQRHRALGRGLLGLVGVLRRRRDRRERGLDGLARLRPLLRQAGHRGRRLRRRHSLVLAALAARTRRARALVGRRRTRAGLLDRLLVHDEPAALAVLAGLGERLHQAL